MGSYFKNRLNQVEHHRKFFAKEGFVLPFVEEIIRKARLSVWDSYHLFYYAKRIPDRGTYLEIGAGIGGSALCAYLAAQAAKTSVNFITVDSRVDEIRFAEITKLVPGIKLLLFPSDVAKDRIQNNSIDLCFIDGSHEYEQVKKDFLNYWAKIKMGGILLGHDYISQHPGVIKAADEIFGQKLNLLKNSAIFKVGKTIRESKEIKCDIITPTYNRPKLLQRAIKSVLAQISPNWEHWIYDDGSDYDIESIVAKFGDARIHFIRGPKRTATERFEKKRSPSAVARNILLRRSKNELIAYLDDDDYFWPEAIGVAINHFKKFPERDAIYGRLTLSNENTENLPREKRKSRMFKNGLLNPCQVIHRRKCLECSYIPENIGWAPTFQFHELLRRKYGLFPIDFFLVNHWNHPFGMIKLHGEEKQTEKRRE